MDAVGQSQISDSGESSATDDSGSGLPASGGVPALRDRAGRFPPGVSGNRRGRPPVLRHVRELAQCWTELAVMTLVDVARDPGAHPGARVLAARELLDRGHGRAAPADADLSRLPVETLSDGELEALERASELEDVDRAHRLGWERYAPAEPGDEDAEAEDAEA